MRKASGHQDAAVEWITVKLSQAISRFHSGDDEYG